MLADRKTHIEGSLSAAAALAADANGQLPLNRTVASWRHTAQAQEAVEQLLLEAAAQASSPRTGGASGAAPAARRRGAPARRSAVLEPQRPALARGGAHCVHVPLIPSWCDGNAAPSHPSLNPRPPHHPNTALALVAHLAYPLARSSVQPCDAHRPLRCEPGHYLFHCSCLEACKARLAGKD